MSDLARRHCEPCRPGTPALAGEEVESLGAMVHDDWAVEEGRLSRTFGFPDFARALDFVNRVGAVAEAEDHHPDVHLRWGAVTLTVWTHTVGGLTENDFILAAKVDALTRGT